MRNKTLRSFPFFVYFSVLMMAMLTPAYAITTTIEPAESNVNSSDDAYTATLNPTGGPLAGFYFLNITIPAGYTLVIPASGDAFGTYAMLNITSGTNKVIINIISNTDDPNGYSVNVTYSTDYGATYNNSNNQNISNMLIGVSMLNMTKPTASTAGYINISLGGTAGPIDPAINNVTVTLANGTLRNPGTAGSYTWYLEAKNSPAGTAYTSSNVVTITNRSGIIFFDNVESGINDWTNTSLWHITTKRYSSASHSWWYGQESTGNYYTGSNTPNSGFLTSREISLEGITAPTLSFMTWYSTEPDTNYDKKIVQISQDNGSTWTTLKNISGTQSAWYLETIDLSAYANMTIKIRFYFDTIDAVYNKYEGWYIDDVKVETPTPLDPLYVSVSESPDPVTSGNTSTVTVHVSTTGGASVSNASVNVSVTGGILSPTSGITDANGDFKANYTAPTVASNTTYTISATASKTGHASGSGNDTITVYTLPDPGIIFFENVESGINGWTNTSLWHITTKRYNSPGHSWWYGQESTGDYNTGARNSGYLTSQAISLAGATYPRLSFMSWYKTEDTGTAWDIKKVQISSDGGATWTDLKQISDTPSQWNPETIDLSSYSGMTIRIRFFFDTIDNVQNKFEGWYIDDVKVETLNPLYVSVSESPDPVTSGNTSIVTVHVNTTGSANVSNAFVNVSVTGGILSPSSGTTDVNGDFKANYTAPAVISNTTYTISSTASKTGYENGSGNDTITVIPSTSGTIFYDNVESGINDWTNTSLWHITTKRSSSASHSWWYGQESTGNYNTGATNSGFLTSKEISLAGITAPRLSFMTWYSTEPDINYDTKIVQISQNNGSTWTNLKQISGTQSTWYIETIDLSTYANMTIKIRFYFDTKDGLYNNYEGWYIDDVKVEN